MVTRNLNKENLHQPGAEMISNSSPPVKVDFSDSEADMTPYGGVELSLRSATRSGAFRDLPAGIQRERGWTDGQMLLSLCLLNILGYDCVEDVDRLEADEGLCRLVGRHETRILGVSRRKLRRRHRKGRKRTFPSSRSLVDWLHAHHDDAAGWLSTRMSRSNASMYSATVSAFRPSPSPPGSSASFDIATGDATFRASDRKRRPTLIESLRPSLTLVMSTRRISSN